MESFDITVIKRGGREMLRYRIPIVVAAGAPTNQAVKLAKNVNLTVASLARGHIMCIFSGEERIT